MPEAAGASTLMQCLRTYGADLSRWPDRLQAAAREALLADPNFRRAWESERLLDRALAEHRDGLDREIARSGAVSRLLGRLPVAADPLGGFRWRAVAAATLVAAVLGGALDLALIDRSVEPAETELLDPLAALDEADIR